MNYDVEITYLNDVFLKINCSPAIAQELNDHFSFYVPGYKFMPAYKVGMWDGLIRLFTLKNNTIYAGLKEQVEKFCKNNKYTITSELRKVSCLQLNDNELKSLISKIPLTAYDKNIQVRDDQFESIKELINNPRKLLLSATSSGKSLIAYVTLRILTSWKPETNCLLIVPTVGLVHQIYNDFKDYSSKDNEWKVEDKCHLIFSGQEKQTNKSITISTWQSLYKMPKEFFDKYKCVFVDECHQAKSDSIKGILEKLTDCPYRYGMTGTLDDSKCHRLVLEGLLGSVHVGATTKELMDNKDVAKLLIRCIILGYNEKIRKELARISYHGETNSIVLNPKRNEFICNLANTIKGNTLILYQLVEKHGKVLYEILKKTTNKKIFFVSGKVSGEERNNIKQIVEKENDCIIVASYKTFATGMSIRNLHNIIFACPHKSKILVLQSIGRVLRKNENKDNAVLYDISDDLQYKGYINYGIKHLSERLKHFIRERFDYEMVKIPLE